MLKHFHRSLGVFVGQQIEKRNAHVQMGCNPETKRRKPYLMEHHRLCYWLSWSLTYITSAQPLNLLGKIASMSATHFFSFLMSKLIDASNGCFEDAGEFVPTIAWRKFNASMGTITLEISEFL